MIRVFSLAALIVVSLIHRSDAIVAAGQTTSAVAAELTQIEHRLVKSWIAGDRSAVDSILASVVGD